MNWGGTREGGGGREEGAGAGLVDPRLTREGARYFKTKNC